MKIGVIALGALICFYPLSHGGLFSPLMVIGLGLILVGWKFAPSARSVPPVPSGFNATYWCKNIAIDQQTRNLWVRDESGTTAVLQPSEIVSWQAHSSTGQHQTTIGPREVHLGTKLFINTRNLAKPQWIVPFNAHFSRSMSGSRANFRELNEWSARLGAFYSQA